ncbi:MAG: class I SAM-dependent methyltransferase [Candidatus Polarisedimenticolia bacterium]
MVDFDERAATWDDDPAKVERARRVADAIERLVPPTGREAGFEYGCGTGLLTFALRPRLAKATLADSSEGMLAVLAKKIAAAHDDALTPLRLDLTRDPLPAERFDLVYTLLTMHHVPDVDAVLRAFHALLANGGHVAVADLDAEDGSFHGPDEHVHRGFERADFARRLEAAGFADVAFATPFEIAKGDRLYPVFLAVGRKRG